jgi:hypothetical protein
MGLAAAEALPSCSIIKKDNLTPLMQVKVASAGDRVSLSLATVLRATAVDLVRAGSAMWPARAYGHLRAVDLVRAPVGLRPGRDRDRGNDQERGESATFHEL